MGAGMNNGLLHAGIVAALPVGDELTTRVVVRLKDRRLENHRRVPSPQLAGRANCR